MKSIESIINKSIAMISNHDSFKKWSGGKKIKSGDLIIINNSFIYRDQNTNKSDKYLALIIGPKGDVQDIMVAIGLTTNNDFNHFSISHPERFPELIPIASSIEDQLANVGKVIFSLIGTVKDDIIISEKFECGIFKEIFWNPQQDDLLSIADKHISIKSPNDENTLWDAFTSKCKFNNIAFDPEKTKNQFGCVLDALQANAESHLIFPVKSSNNIDGITDSILKALEERREEYLKALGLCKGQSEINPQAYIEVLRIAYNFSNDVIPFLNLLISICDLKPIILWATIGEHFSLSEAFKNLPWSRSKNKFSMKNYIDIIGDARNSVFHNLFPFKKALRLLLPSDSLVHTELRFFSEYGSGKNVLTYNDKKLIELLLAFTRARQRPIPTDFWEKNIQVMENLISLVKATNKIIKEIYLLVD